MTYRERREAKADRLRGWADKRDDKAAGAFATADTIAERFPLGQPILVGHHSEARARRDQDRITASMRRGIEDSGKADEMRERADNIERAAARAIYSDDPDAADALRAKIDKLEAERGRLKAYNASCRAAAKTDPEAKHGDLSILDDRQRADFLSLLQVCPYQVGRNGQFPGYASSNIGGTITAARKRLASLSARAAHATTAGYPTCSNCGSANLLGGTIDGARVAECNDCGQVDHVDGDASADPDASPFD